MCRYCSLVKDCGSAFMCGLILKITKNCSVSLLTPLCPIEDVFCCQNWRAYSTQRIEWNSPVDLGVGITCFHLIELGWTGYDEI